jgi:penicillin-binding protein-related factor A (putative recombinase)
VIPKKLSGAEFEFECLFALRKLESRGVGTFGRYGVQAVRTSNEWQIMQSLPDFEGVIAGKQIIFDAKVCTQASFPWAKYRSETKGPRARQLRHMVKRSEFGAKCGFLLHWNARDLKTKQTEAATFWIPVFHSVYWQAVERGEIKNLNREDCNTFGFPVVWERNGRERKSSLGFHRLFFEDLLCKK